MIKQAYLAQLVQWDVPSALASECWFEIEAAYTEAGRYFHDLSHIERVFSALRPLLFDDWETVLFAIVYHDVVYDVSQHTVQHDNEERSAAFAERQLSQISYPPEKIEKCCRLILATKDHQATPDNDTNLFTDADLCILGQPWALYDAYRQNVRREYEVYPDSIYNAGRRQVLLHFLQMNPLFKTRHFHQLYEEAAKENMQKELELLRS